ncbi:MAG: MFS transporter [Burkholderia sp.]
MDSSFATSRSAGAASPARAAIAVLALGLGCFCFVSTELMPLGVLPAMAAGLGVSLGEAGYLVSCFAFVVALAAMPLTGLLGGLDRKPLMAALLAVCAAGNLLTYLAPGYLIVLAGRILVAAAIAVFWSTAVVTAVQLVAPKRAVHATLDRVRRRVAHDRARHSRRHPARRACRLARGVVRRADDPEPGGVRRRAGIGAAPARCEGFDPRRDAGGAARRPAARPAPA